MLKQFDHSVPSELTSFSDGFVIFRQETCASTDQSLLGSGRMKRQSMPRPIVHCALYTTVHCTGMYSAWHNTISAMPCSAVQWQCSAAQCSVVQCSAVQCSEVQCSAVQWAVQCRQHPVSKSPYRVQHIFIRSLLYGASRILSNWRDLPRGAGLASQPGGLATFRDEEID